MTEPKRWIEDGAPEAITRLLDAARLERPSKDSLSRTLSAVGVGTVTATTTAATGATLGAAGVSGVMKTKGSIVMSGVSALKWMMVGVGVGGGVVAAVEHDGREQQRAPREIVAGIQHSGIARARALPNTQLRETESPMVDTAPPTDEPTAGNEASSKSAPPPATRGAAWPATPRSEPSRRLAIEIDSERLAEEVRAIDAANTALANGQPARTLTALDDYDRRYPEHRFAPEALYLRMEALLHSGQGPEARGIAKQLITSYPQSPQAARARSVLSQTIP